MVSPKGTHMPLYEYQCEKCATRTEVVQRFSDPPVTVCESCGGSVRKLISSPAIQFKGSGFYITDYAKPGSGGKAGEGSSTSSSSSSSGSEPKKAESKEASGAAKPGAASGSSSD